MQGNSLSEPWGHCSPNGPPELHRLATTCRASLERPAGWWWLVAASLLLYQRTYQKATKGYFNIWTHWLMRACVRACVRVCVRVCVPGEVVEDAVLRFHQLVQHTLSITIHQRNTGQLVSFFCQTLKHNISTKTDIRDTVTLLSSVIDNQQYRMPRNLE